MEPEHLSTPTNDEPRMKMCAETSMPFGVQYPPFNGSQAFGPPSIHLTIAGGLNDRYWRLLCRRGLKAFKNLVPTLFLERLRFFQLIIESTRYEDL